MRFITILILLWLAAPGRPQGLGKPRLDGAVNLSEAVGFALRNHPALDVADSEWRAAEARVLEAEAAFWPKLGAGLYANGGNAPMIVSGGSAVEPAFWSALPAGGSSLNLTAMLPLYTGGRLQARLERTRAEERAQLARTALTLRELARDARRAYYDVLQAQARRETARWKLTQAEELNRLTERKVQLGSLAPYVSLRVEAEVAAARQDLNQALADERSARLRLAVALGAALDSRMELEPPPPGQAPSQALSLDTEQSLRDRPDLVVARALVQAFGQRLQETLSTYSPQLTLYAMGERMRQPALVNQPFEAGYQVGLVVSLPLFDGERDARGQEAEAMLSARQQEVQRLEQIVAGEVARSRVELDAALQNEVLAEAEVRAAAAQLKIARLRFDLGRGLYLEVLDAISVQVRARQNATSAQRQRGVAEAEYLYALGRLL